MRKNVSLLWPALLLMACGGNSTSTTKKDSAARPIAASDRPAEAAGEKVLISGETPVVEVTRNAAIYYGKRLKCSFANLQKAVVPELPILLSQINLHKAVMTGSLTYVYLSEPGPGDMDVFVGIPVKAAFAKPEMGEFLTVEGGTFYKFNCTAETGNTLSEHKALYRFRRRELRPRLASWISSSSPPATS